MKYRNMSCFYYHNLIKRRILDYYESYSKTLVIVFIYFIYSGDDEYELISLIQPSNQFDGLFDYVKNRTLVSEYWDVVLNSTSMVSDENQLLINQKYEWKKLKKIKLNMDILKLYESVLYENVLNIKQLFERNEQNIKGPNVSNCQGKKLCTDYLLSK